jgi:hypothetical protein
MGFAYLGMSFQEQEAAKGVSATMIFGLSLLVVFLAARLRFRPILMTSFAAAWIWSTGCSRTSWS